jgi:hypothetical protein
MFFSVVDKILRRNLLTIAISRNLNVDQAKDAVVRHLSSMSAEWYSGEAPNIAYEDPLCRWAYMFAHVPVQANLFQRVIEECARGDQPFREKLGQPTLSMVIFGGGPGTELLGLAKYYLKQGKDEDAEHSQVDVDLDVIDRVGAWNENVALVKDEISSVYATEFGSKRAGWPALFDIHAFSYNFTDLDAFGNLTTIFKRDIFVLNFVVSEVFDLDELLPIMQKMVAGCRSGAHFLFIDRSDSITTSKVDKLITELKLEVVGGAETADSMDTDEQKAELQEISDFLQGKQPRLKWKAKWVLAIKPKPTLRTLLTRKGPPRE